MVAYDHGVSIIARRGLERAAYGESDGDLNDGGELISFGLTTEAVPHSPQLTFTAVQRQPVHTRTAMVLTR